MLAHVKWRSQRRELRAKLLAFDDKCAMPTRRDSSGGCTAPATSSSGSVPSRPDATKTVSNWTAGRNTLTGCIFRSLERWSDAREGCSMTFAGKVFKHCPSELNSRTAITPLMREMSSIRLNCSNGSSIVAAPVSPAPWFIWETAYSTSASRRVICSRTFSRNCCLASRTMPARTRDASAIATAGTQPDDR